MRVCGAFNRRKLLASDQILEVYELVYVHEINMFKPKEYIQPFKIYLMIGLIIMYYLLFLHKANQTSHFKFHSVIYVTRFHDSAIIMFLFWRAYLSVLNTVVMLFFVFFSERINRMV